MNYSYIATFFVAVFLLSRTRNLDLIYDPIIYFFYAHALLFGFGLVYYESLWGQELSEFAKNIPHVLLLLYVSVVVFFDFLFKTSKDSAQQVRSYHSNIFDGIKGSDVLASKLLFLIGVSISFIYMIFIVGIDSYVSDDLNNLRVELRKGYGWLALLVISSVTISTFLLSAYYIKNNKILKLFFILLIAFFSLIVIGNRAPAFELLLLVFFLYHLSKYGNVSPVILLLILCLLFVILAIFNIYRQGGVFELQNILVSALWRPYVNIDNFNEVFEYYSVEPLLSGYTYIIDMLVVLPGYQPNFGLFFKNVSGMVFSGGGVTVTYAGEIFANFGMYSLLPVAAVYYTLLYFVSRFFIKKLSMFSFIHLIIISITIKSIVSSGIVSPLLYTYFPFLFILIFLALLSLLIKTTLRAKA